MKVLRLFLFGILVLHCSMSQAQVSPSELLEWIDGHLKNCDCAKAQDTYNLYKDKVPEGNDSIKERIKERIDKCWKDRLKPTTSPQGTSESTTKPTKKGNKFMDFLKDRDNPYCRSERNRYIAWTFLGAGYPWNATMGVEIRGGGILGIGGYADLGVDISRYPYEYIVHQDDDVISSKRINVHGRFRYIGGVRFFYKGLFLSLGYGAIARVRSVTLEYNSTDDYWEHSDEDLSKIVKGHGLHFNIGYNGAYIYNGNGFFLGVSGGLAYDIANKAIYPSVNIKFGWAFYWNKL